MTLIKVFLFAAFFVVVSNADPLVATPLGGMLSLLRSNEQTWSTFGDSVILSSGDSLLLADAGQVIISRNGRPFLRLRDSASFSIRGPVDSPMVLLGSGQIFLNLESENESVSISAGECTFSGAPVSAAVKMNGKRPSIAVLAGTAHASSPWGSSILVNSGQFATYDPATGSFNSGDLNPRATQALSKWSGINLVSSDKLDTSTRDDIGEERASLLAIDTSGMKTYLVKENESASLIALRHYGYYNEMVGDVLSAANPSLSSVDSLPTGYSLMLPDPDFDTAGSVQPLIQKNYSISQGMVTLIRGDVNLLRGADAETTGATLLSVNTEVLPDDIIRTGPGARIELIVARRHVVRAGANTEFALKSFYDPALADGLTDVSVTAGQVWATVAPHADTVTRFQLTLPNVTAGVHGTSFSATVRADKTSEVKVFEGTVGVSGASWSKMVGSMERVDVSAEGAVPEVRPFSANEVDDFTSWNRELNQRVSQITNSRNPESSPVTREPESVENDETPEADDENDPDVQVSAAPVSSHGGDSVVVAESGSVEESEVDSTDLAESKAKVDSSASSDAEQSTEEAVENSGEEKINRDSSQNVGSVEPRGEPDQEKGEKDSDSPDAPRWVIGASMVTVDDNGTPEQWTMLGLGVDIPIWRFGVFLDLEIFMNSQGQFANKGWDFRDNWYESVFRKIRYIRYNHEGDPVFAKFGGLSNVTLGYGFVVNRFTNMLQYPDNKLLGLQFQLNNVTSIGIDLHTFIADFQDFEYDGGVVGGRFAVRPMKPTGIPILKGISIGATAAADLDQYAEGRKWKSNLDFTTPDADSDGLIDRAWGEKMGWDKNAMDTLTAAGHLDTRYVNPEFEHADTSHDRYAVIGGDIGVPLVDTKLFGLTVYGQGAMSFDRVSESDRDKTRGWGVGMPGALLTLGPLWAQAEYRHINGEFEPGYFNTYYLEDRIQRSPSVRVKEETLSEQDLNGVFGTLGVDIFGVFTVSGSYQRLVGEEEELPVFRENGSSPVRENFTYTSLDQRFEATATVGEKLISRIPKLTRAELFFDKSNIQRTYMLYKRPDGYNEPVPIAPGEGDEPFDKFFGWSPDTYWGYRLGGEVVSGTSIIWETRHGYKFDNNGEREPNNSVTISAGMGF